MNPRLLSDTALDSRANVADDHADRVIKTLLGHREVHEMVVGEIGERQIPIEEGDDGQHDAGQSKSRDPPHRLPSDLRPTGNHDHIGLE